MDPNRFKRKEQTIRQAGRDLARRGQRAVVVRPVPPATPVREAQKPVAVPAPAVLAQQPAPVAPAPVATPKPVAARPKVPAEAEQSAVNIQITLPEFHKPEFKRLKAFCRRIWALHSLFSLKRVLVPIIAVVLVAGVIVGIKHFTGNSAKHSASGSAKSSSAGAAVAAKPTFTPVVPQTEPQLAQVGAHSAFDGAHGVYSFTDVLGKQQITVSEQQITSGSASDDAQASAKSLNATHIISTKTGDAYVFNNTKYNSQNVVTSIKNLLVFMQSSQIYGDSDWKTYIESLQ